MNSPKEIASVCSEAGVAKSQISPSKTFVLAIFAGVFIAMAGLVASVASCTVSNPSVARIISAAVFPAGLTMVILAGSELFTGNCLLIIPVLQKRIKVTAMLKNLVIAYIGNLIGAVIVAILAVVGNVFSLYGGAFAEAVVNTAVSKVSMPFGEVFVKGILCNFLVCLAVWMAFSAKTPGGKFIALFFPIFIFIAAGFEHCVANMYYIPAGIFTSISDKFASGSDLLTLGSFILKNLLPSTLGNILGGAALIGTGYWYVYLK